MSRSLWRCRNPACPTPHGAVLGRLTSEDGLVLDPRVQSCAVYLDTRRAVVACPECGAEREFRGTMLVLPRDAQNDRAPPRSCECVTSGGTPGPVREVVVKLS